MSRKYKFRDQSYPHFITMTIINWVDLFTRSIYCELVLKNLQYCINNKGLEVYAWCIMPSHIHMIIGTSNEPMQGIIRDFKSYTSKLMVDCIYNSMKESRKNWLLKMFKEAGLRNGNNKKFQLWQQHNHPIELSSDRKFNNCIEYTHQNPVIAGYVRKPEHWRWSSAVDYAGKKGLIEIKR